MRELFDLGGWAMWPLLVFSVATISLILERALFLLYHNLSVKDSTKAILDSLERGRLDEAQAVCESAAGRKVGPRIFKAGLNAVSLGEHRIERALEGEASKEINTLQRGFDLLIALGSIAPITGFLGTVSGMISAFQSIATAADINAQLVAGGIFEALITTAYGLAIAILAIAGYNLFAYFVDRFAANVEESGNAIISTILNHGSQALANGETPEKATLPGAAPAESGPEGS
jgi:biopolymer transport protein ExbB